MLKSNEIYLQEIEDLFKNYIEVIKHTIESTNDNFENKSEYASIISKYSGRKIVNNSQFNGLTTQSNNKINPNDSSKVSELVGLIKDLEVETKQLEEHSLQLLQSIIKIDDEIRTNIKDESKFIDSQIDKVSGAYGLL